MIACALLITGLMTDTPYHTQDSRFFGAGSYRAYVQNPSPFPFVISGIELVVKDDTRDEFHGIHIKLPKTKIAPETSTTITFQELDVDTRSIAGSIAECGLD